MRTFRPAAMLASALACCAPQTDAIAEDGEARFAWSGSATAASDYVFRGVSQSQRKPVLQLDIELAHAAGGYAGAFASNVDYTAPGDEDDGIVREYAVRAGWRLAMAWGTIDLSAQHMVYPGARDGFDADYTEYGVAFELGEHVALHVGHAPDYYNFGAAATDYGIDVGRDFGTIAVWLGAGYFDQDALAGTGYRYIDLLASRQFGRWLVEAGWSRAFDYGPAIAEINGDSRLARGHGRIAMRLDF